MSILTTLNSWKTATLSAVIALPLLTAIVIPMTTQSATAEASQRYLVQYSTSQAKQVLTAAAGTENTRFFDNLNMVAADLTASEKEQLSHTAGITRIDANENYQGAAQAFAANVKAVTVKGQEQASWGYGAVDAQIALNKNYTGKGVKVAILDTGISAHSDLKIAGGVSLVKYTSSYTDDNGHGTFVAGVIGAQDNGKGLIGEAPDASIYAVKILDTQGNGSTEDLASGINWAIQNKMDIVNMSIAFPQDSPVVEQMLQTAHDQGILLIAAAGNKGTANTTQDTIEFPAKSSYVMAVTAVDDNLERASFSATGAEADVAAPGANIVSTSTNGRYELRDGTSVAAPFVAGLAATLKQAYPQLTNDQLRHLIEVNSIDLGTAGRDDLYGYGMISFQHVFDPGAASR